MSPDPIVVLPPIVIRLRPVEVKAGQFDQSLKQWNRRTRCFVKGRVV